MRPIFVIQHVCAVNDYELLLARQIGRFEKHGLTKSAVRHIVGIVGERVRPDEYECLQHKMSTRYLGILTLGEEPTLKLLHRVAMINPEAAILYTHLKGITHSRDEECQSAWNDCMMWHLVDNWEECVEKLDECDVVSSIWSEKPYPHANGNMFWCTGEHAVKCGLPVQLCNRYDCEAWIGKGNPKVAHAFTPNRDLYEALVQPSEYEKEVIEWNIREPLSCTDSQKAL